MIIKFPYTCKYEGKLVTLLGWRGAYLIIKRASGYEWELCVNACQEFLSSCGLVLTTDGDINT